MADDKVTDRESGISLRFVRQYDIEADKSPLYLSGLYNPTVGAIVHFVNPQDGTHSPAVVTHVHTEGVAGVVRAVDLCVTGRYRIGHEHDVAMDQETNREGTWHWPERA